MCLPLPNYTAVLIKKVLGVYNHSMETIYLSLRAQVAVGTFFMKSPVLDIHILKKNYIKDIYV